MSSNRTRTPHVTDKQSGFSNIVSSYLEGLLDRNDGIPELEIRFGTRGNQPTSKQNFDNVIQKLLASGFIFSKKNAYALKIQNELVKYVSNRGFVLPLCEFITVEDIRYFLDNLE